MKILTNKPTEHTERLQATINELYPNVEGSYKWGQVALSKTAQLEKFFAAGLDVPEYTKDINKAMAWVNDGRLVFGRREFSCGGKYIYAQKMVKGKITCPPKWVNSEWWSLVVTDVASEWRVHIFEGRYIGKGLKVKIGESKTSLPIKNRRNGWLMVHNQEIPKGLRQVAKTAVNALGYRYGAVDVIETVNGDFIVLEVNSRPGMDRYTSEIYAKAICEGGM